MYPLVVVRGQVCKNPIKRIEHCYLEPHGYKQIDDRVGENKIAKKCVQTLNRRRPCSAELEAAILLNCSGHREPVAESEATL